MRTSLEAQHGPPRRPSCMACGPKRSVRGKGVDLLMTELEAETAPEGHVSKMNFNQLLLRVLQLFILEWKETQVSNASSELVIYIAPFHSIDRYSSLVRRVLKLAISTSIVDAASLESSQQNPETIHIPSSQYVCSERPSFIMACWA